MWNVECKVWSGKWGLLSVKCGVRGVYSVECVEFLCGGASGLQSIEGVECMVWSGVWSVECGCKMWSVERGV